VAVLRREIDRMQGVLDELLNFSRPLSPLALDRVAPAELLGEVARLHEGVAAQGHVTVAVDPGAETCEEVRCDRRKVLQALVNLVQNAIEASPRGGHITLRAEAAGGQARLSVEDEGPGLSEEIRARVFEPGVTSKRTGSGLGLTIARALARQHGGDVTLERGARGVIASVVLPTGGA
jgi:two-component system sensor histidine kinase HydH